MKVKNMLLLVDPQNDFCDPAGALFVPGAAADSRRTAAMIGRVSCALDELVVTLDCHHVLDVAHPLMWVDREGEHPLPFTEISLEDLENGTWKAVRPEWQDRLRQYVSDLEAFGRYRLTIWPEHCLVGSWGFGVVPCVFQAVTEWEREHAATAALILKGENPWTEHYSAVRAEVPDPGDARTAINRTLLERILSSDCVAVAGQALSHCVANTVRDLVEPLGGDLSRLVLVRDCTSSVPGFEALGEAFLEEMAALGMRLDSSDRFLA
jgi:nicotinamidase-related amidase